MWKRKNINIYLSTELVFLIITSLIVFTNQPLNWIVAILMFMHLIGIAWLVANPNNFYQMAEDSINLDEGLLENVVVITFLIYAGMALFSRIMFYKISKNGNDIFRSITQCREVDLNGI